MFTVFTKSDGTGPQKFHVTVFSWFESPEFVKSFEQSVALTSMQHIFSGTVQLGSVGHSIGETVGDVVGDFVGVSVGDDVVGDCDGCSVGDGVGDTDG